MKANKPKPYTSIIIDDMFDEISEADFEKTNKKMKLAIKIADAIEAKGMSKKEFALSINQQPSVISKWLSGTHNFTIDTLIDLEGQLNMNLLAINQPKQIDKKVIYQTVLIKHDNMFVDNFSIFGEIYEVGKTYSATFN